MEVASGLLLVAVFGSVFGVICLALAARSFFTSAQLQRQTLDAILAMSAKPQAEPSAQAAPVCGPLEFQLDGKAPLPPLDSHTIPDLMVRYATEVASLMDLTAWISTWLSDDQLKLVQLIIETPGLKTEFLPDSETTNLGFLRSSGLVVASDEGHALVPAPFHEPIRRVAKARKRHLIAD